MLCKALQDDGDDDKLGVCIIHDMHGSVGKGSTAPYIFLSKMQCQCQFIGV